MLPLSIRVAEDHGRQKAHYLDYMNHVCLFNARGKRRFVTPYSGQYPRNKMFLENY